MMMMMMTAHCTTLLHTQQSTWHHHSLHVHNSQSWVAKRHLFFRLFFTHPSISFHLFLLSFPLPFPSLFPTSKCPSSQAKGFGGTASFASRGEWHLQPLNTFHRSRHWSVASPAWVGSPAERRTNWFWCKNCSMWVTLDSNWDNNTLLQESPCFQLLLWDTWHFTR